MTARVERVVTSGTFELDGGSWEVDNNVWLLGDDEQVVAEEHPARGVEPGRGRPGGRQREPASGEPGVDPEADQRAAEPLVDRDDPVRAAEQPPFERGEGDGV